MAGEREAFLQRVRQAVKEGNRAGVAAVIEPRGGVGYQGAGPDPVARFCQQLTTAGGQAHVVADAATAAARVVSLVQSKSAAHVLLGTGPYLDPLGLVERLAALNIRVTSVAGLTPETAREPFFGAEIGISGVAALIAETGSIVMAARPDEPRSVSLLPPLHIAVAHRSQVVPDLFDLFQQLGFAGAMPSCLTLITGPSKTGDIELKLVTGVHGPGEVHVVLISET